MTSVDILAETTERQLKVLHDGSDETDMASPAFAGPDYDERVHEHPSDSSDVLESESPNIASVNVAPLTWPIQSPVRSFVPLQQWECAVTEVGEGYVCAEMRDLTTPSPDIEVAEFPIEEFSTDDHPLLREGAVFYWSIGYDDTGGQRRRTSELRVRRTPSWTKREVSALRRRGAELLKQFEGDDG